MKSPKAPAAPDPNVVSAAQTTSNIDTAAYNNALEHGNTTSPLGSQTFTGRVDPTTGATVYDQSITLSPEQQQLYDQQNQQDLALGNTAQRMLGSVDSAYSTPFSTEGMPALRDAPAQGQFGTNAGQTDQIDMSNLPELFGSNDLLGARQQVQDALYNQHARYLDPQYQQRENQMNIDLANKGVVEGTEAWRNARDQYQREREAEYGQARNSAITAGGSEMGLLSGIASQNRGQLYDERYNNASFGNQARATNADFANQGIGANNAAAMQQAQFGNDARNQALSEAMMKRAMPLNEFNALRNSSQVEMPQFADQQDAQVQPTDTAGNVWNQYQGQMGLYNSKVGTQNANTAAGATMVGTGLMAAAIF